MINISNITKDDRTCKALTGQSIESFNLLLPLFEQALISSKSQNKVYPTYDLFGILTNRSRSKCCESVKILLPILEIALGRSCVLPKRKIKLLSDFYGSFGNIKDIFIDGVERPVQRPSL